MKRLALATDFSERSDRALRRAVLLSRRSGAVIDLVHVIDDDRPRRIVEQEKHEAWLLLTELAGSLKSVDGVASTIRIELADPFAGILKSVDDPAPDMLVIGPHRRQILRDAFHRHDGRTHDTRGHVPGPDGERPALRGLRPCHADDRSLRGLAQSTQTARPAGLLISVAGDPY
ncbi:MAG: hypothetical protein C6Y20_21710 [Tagaea sp. CACIAM 22H2]|nr:hypothetical protein [Tagaea sp. CACIAM 22H2]